MAGGIFPQVFMYNGRAWRMAYDPANAATVRPSLEGSTVESATCHEVTIPGVKSPRYMVVFFIVFPSRVLSNGRVSPERRLMAVRVYEYRVASTDQVNPEEMIFYISDPVDGGATNPNQAILDAMLAESMRPQPAQVVDRNWAETLTIPQHEVEDAPAYGTDTGERGTPDDTI